MGTESRLKPPIVERTCPPIPIVKSTYPQRVSRTICQLSEADKVREALKEWSFNGESEDHDEPVETCELCGKHGLRYRFQIENRLNHNMLWVGSKCILRFGIPVYDENGRLLDQRGARRKLNDLIWKKQNESCVKALGCIAACETDYREMLYDALNYYRLHEYLSLKYARVVFWRLEKYKIAHTPEFFKLRLRSQRDKDTLHAMPLRDVHMLWRALSPGQRRLAIRLGHCAPG